MQLAARIGQPQGSAIYFAVDHDYYKPADLAVIRAYFAAVSGVIGGAYRVGVFGSGAVARAVLDTGHAELVWLAATKSWSGTKAMLRTSDWALLQSWPPIGAPLDHDGNTVSPAWPEFGQFTPGASALQHVHPTPNVVLMEVTARSALNVRRGPDQSYPVDAVLPRETLVHALGGSGDWVLVDLNGDGEADGYVLGGFLAPVSGGFPLPEGRGAASDGVLTPYQIAKAELSFDLREVSAIRGNPRVVTFHNSTGASVGVRDDVPWCASFVNYCVKQAGLSGTNSQWALHWDGWGRDVTETPREGDIAVFERGKNGGHVCFVVEDLPDQVKVLGADRDNRIKISFYPKDGKMGPMRYRLKSFRRW